MLREVKSKLSSILVEMAFSVLLQLFGLFSYQGLDLGEIFVDCASMLTMIGRNRRVNGVSFVEQ